MIRKACPSDMRELLDVVREGRARIRALGIDQWTNGYPGEVNFQGDMERGECWVSVDAQGKVDGVMTVMLTPDESYAEIDGKWLVDRQLYGSVHRMAVADRASGKGVSAEMMRFAEQLSVDAGAKSIRVDTHLGNKAMNRFLQKNGFSYCGIVRVISTEIGDNRRNAYEKIL